MVANLGLGTSLEHVEVDLTHKVKLAERLPPFCPDVGMGEHNVYRYKYKNASSFKDPLRSSLR
eukprot:261989-Hanusia_phi.AAC.1